MRTKKTMVEIFGEDGYEETVLVMLTEEDSKVSLVTVDKDGNELLTLLTLSSEDGIQLWSGIEDTALPLDKKGYLMVSRI